MTAVWVMRNAAASSASVLPSGLSSWYRTTAMATSAMNITMSAASPARKSMGESMMFRAVALGSPGSMSWERTPISANRPQAMMIT